MSPAKIIYLCTGNAARSVMATVMTRHRAGARLHVRGAGTFSIPGLPMSTRTKAALAAFDLGDPQHRSRQLSDDDAGWADLIVGFEPQHVEYVRRELPAAASRTGTIARLARQLAPSDQPLVQRVAALALQQVELEPWEEVVDPAGGDEPVFHACAAEISELLDRFLPSVLTPEHST